MLLTRKMGLIVVILCVSVMCAEVALAGVLAEDNFNDNIRNETLWSSLYIEENGSVDELNHRLEYTSTGAPTGENYAYYGLGMNLAYNGTWTATMDVHVGNYGLTPDDHGYGIEMAVYSPDSTQGEYIFLGLYRGEEDGAGYFGWELCNDYGTGEEYWDDDADSSDGSVKLVWNEDGNHLFKGYYKKTGASAWTELATNVDLNDWVWDATPEADRILHLGIGGYDEGTDETLGDGSEMYLDNFGLVPEPATMGLLVLGGMGVLLRRRK
ncbi:MAG: PEP-CTERM sorting domain-containing protein [Phycisphaerae bacterium]|nr:PEP-CTERM sorting domain-containing protein [Phycisphaerae bacterium]